MKITATMLRTLFQSNRNHWAVAIWRMPDSPDAALFKICSGRGGHSHGDGKCTFTSAGNINPLQVGATYELEGRIVSSKYGPQLELSAARIQVSSGGQDELFIILRKRLGVRTAQQIVDAYPSLVQSFRDNRIQEISADVYEKIRTEWESLVVNAGAVRRLGEMGIADTYHQKIFERWHADVAIEKIQENPYTLMEIPGIGFKRADTIALGMNILATDPRRQQAALHEILRQAADSGHTYTYKTTAYSAVADLIQIPDYTANIPDDIEVDDNRLFLKYLWEAEDWVIRTICRILKEKTFESLANDIDISELQERQRDAFIAFHKDKNILVITGGPGTGKTYLARALIESCRANTVALLAPTGKAATRLADATGYPAQTIHSYLQPIGESLSHFALNEENLAKHAIYIVDEFSMVDIHLFSALCRAIPPYSKLVLIGDVDQLPSIGPGNVLHDLILANVPTIRLDKIMRQAEGSTIAENCHRMNTGNSALIASDDFILPILSDERISSYIYEYINQPDTQLIIPMNKGNYGTTFYNKAIQERLNPHGEKIRGTQYRWGDRVIVTRNDYSVGLMNGEMGVILGYDQKVDAEGNDASTIDIHFDGHERPHTLPGTYTENISLGYAITVHKSQGSEYREVIILAHPSHRFMLSRNLLYTAMSRGKERVRMISTKSMLAYATRREKPPRNTITVAGIQQRLEWA
jgi:exodeoxyribonuclease V alpha subunit